MKAFAHFLLRYFRIKDPAYIRFFWCVYLFVLSLVEPLHAIDDYLTTRNLTSSNFPPHSMYLVLLLIGNNNMSVHALLPGCVSDLYNSRFSKKKKMDLLL